MDEVAEFTFGLRATGRKADMELFVQLLLASAAGVLLNLTPCVLPVVPVKVRMIINHSGSKRRDRLAAAAAFLAGTLAFFLVLGVLTATLHWTWGALFHSSITLGLLVAMLASVGVLMFADARIPVPAFALRAGGGRFFEPFSSGAFAALLATPCTGPFLGGVLAFALTQPPQIVLSIFLAIGAGLALPYVVLLVRPGLLAFVPRGGEWSERLRQAMAFILFGGAIFFAASLLPRDFEQWLWWAWALALVVWTGWVVLRRSLGATVIAATFSLLAIVAAYGGGFIVPPSKSALAWRGYTPSEMTAAQFVQQPILLEFTADWCVNCKVLEETVYASPKVAAAVRAVNMSTLRADLTSPDETLERLLVKYGGAGLPYAVVIGARGKVVRTFSGLFTVSDLTKAIRRSASLTKSGSSHET